MTIPRVTVAMSVFDNATYLPAAIASIQAQSFSDFEFLIVDDGSRDESGAIADGCAAADSRLRVIHTPNQGLVRALNLITAQARAPLIARMDGDDIALPDRFARQVAFLDTHPQVDVLGSACTSIDATGAPDGVVEPVVATADIPAHLSIGPPLCHPSVMLRRATLEKVGGYRAAYRHCEDYDLWLRITEQGTLANLDEPLLLYRRTSTQVSARYALEQKYGAAVAWEAHVERCAGRRDPGEGLSHLPPLDALDAMFGREGVTRAVRAKVALGILYNSGALRGAGLDLILDHVRAGGATDGLWRTVARLLTLGAPIRAARLAAALATA